MNDPFDNLAITSGGRGRGAGGFGGGVRLTIPSIKDMLLNPPSDSVKNAENLRSSKLEDISNADLLEAITQGLRDLPTIIADEVKRQLTDLTPTIAEMVKE